MRDWFEALEVRDRQIVLGVAVLALIVVLYGLIWAPMAKKDRELRADIDSLKQSIADIRPLRAALANAGPSQPSATMGSQQSPLIIVDQTLQSRGLDRYRRNSQPTASNGIRVVFEDVAFDELILWLGDLSDHYSMHVQVGDFSAGSRSAPGRINASVTLERSL